MEPTFGFQLTDTNTLNFSSHYKQHHLLLLLLLLVVVKTLPTNWFLLLPLLLTEHIFTFGSWILEEGLPPLALITLKCSELQQIVTQF